MPVPIMTLIPIAIDLVVGLIRAAQEAKEMSEQEFEDIKAEIDREFANMPTWEQL